jgi:polyisoprenoid-binding protein YceI
MISFGVRPTAATAIFMQGDLHASTLKRGRFRHRCRMWQVGVLLFASCALATPRVALAQESILTLDPGQTTIAYTLGATFHTVHGTFQLKRCEIRFDPATGAASGSVIVNATTGESGNDSRDGRMHREIILSQKFPEIVFTPRHVTGPLKDLLAAKDGPKDASEVQVVGVFRLLGKDHDMTLTVSIQPNGSQLQVSSHFSIPYIEWGVKNPNTFVLRVSPTVDIDIHAPGRLAPAN